MIAVMISIKPQWCELITKKEKTIEVRKTRPKIKTPFKCYIYETKGLYRGSGGCLFQGLGKVIGEFVCNYIEEYSSVQSKIKDCTEYQISLQKLCEDIHLSIHEFCSYGNGKPLYGWHISDLVIYDKPISLNGFSAEGDCNANGKDCKKCSYNGGSECLYLEEYTHPIVRPPQSWCYVETKQ